MKRREFIILTGIGATSAGMLSACGHPEEKLIPALIPDEEYVPGIDVWKASTCALCDAGCGIVVRTRDHKANKIEGNPQHPVNRGALCARGQAGLQILYNPDRIKAPLKRVGERGSGQFEEITWDEAIKTLADKLRDLHAQGKAKAAHFFTTDQRGVTAHIATRFMEAYGSQAHVVKLLFNEERAPGSYTSSDSGSSRPVFDIANASFLLSFGARFLETWHSPMMYSLAYGEFRRAKGGTRGRFIQVEPRMSVTGANADEWLPAKSGREALVALAIAQVIARGGLAKAAPDAAFIKSLESYAPEKTASLTDIAADKIIRIAGEFAAAAKPLAIASHTGNSPNSRATMTWVNLLNRLVGNVNQKGGVLLPKREALIPLSRLSPASRFPDLGYSQFSMTIADRPSEILMVHQFNPVFLLPATKEKLKTIPFLVSFSSFMDETTELADLILPDHTSLESWDINSADATDQSVVNLTQPVVKPEFNTKQTADVLLAVTLALGGKVAASLPFASAEEIVKQDFASLANPETPVVTKKAVSSDEESEEGEEGEEEVDTWKPLSEKGFLISKPKVESAPQPQTSSPVWNEVLNDSLLAEAQEVEIREAGIPVYTHYPFTLLAYEHPTLGYGEQANLPILQELPDAMTSVMWGSWLEINPKTAERMGIKDGDLVEVAVQEVDSGGPGIHPFEFEPIRLPAVLYPAIRPDVLAMPCGQGHSAYGRYAKSTGVNAATFAISANGTVQRTIRAKVSKVSGVGKLIRYGTNLPEHIEIKR